jgi:hypothetical protein
MELAECRRTVRVRPFASEVLLDDPPQPGIMAIRDLSVDGAYIHGEAMRSVGRRVRLVLLFPRWQPVAVEARILRARDDEGFAVRFERVPQRTRRLLSDTVSEEVKRWLRREQPRALVVDSSETIRRFVCWAVADFGGSACGEGTVLGALHRLDNEEPPFRTVFIGRPTGSSTALELARYASSHGARSVLLTEDTDHSRSARGDEPAVTLLGKPWSPARLAGFLLPSA